MIPVRLVLSNFLSYGEDPQTLDFTRFHVACLTGANGNGKSALLDAITYALWGQGRKGRHDRKPDEGLLRLGARQMRVEFTFRLDEGCYRVVRSFCRRPKSGTTELDLQMHDPATDLYRPLSEAGAASRTQAQIDHLLAMDYETFVNSSFLVQGRADAFTRKGPRERKDLLAQILGLARYDRMQERARNHLQCRQAELLGVRKRAEELAAELAQRDGVTRGLEEVERELAAIGVDLQRAEDSLQLWRARLLRAIALREELVRYGEDLRTLAQRRSRLDVDVSDVDAARTRDEALVCEADRVQAEACEYEHLCAEEALWCERLDAARPVEEWIADLQQRIAGERHELERQRAAWVARRESLDERLARFDEALTEAQQVEAAWTDLQRARERLDEGRRRRDAWDALDRQRQACAHAISLEERQLAERRRGVEARLAEVRARLAEAVGVEESLEAAETSLEATAKRFEQLQGLREEGTLLRAQADRHRERLGELEAEGAQLSDRVNALGRGELSQCPLCGTDLDDDHRRRIDGELAVRRRDLEAHRAQVRFELEAVELELADRRLRYRRLEERSADLAGLQERVALLRARRRRLEEDRALLRDLETDLRRIGARLADGEYARSHRAELERIDTDLASLGYDADQLEALERRVSAGASTEARHRVLRDSRVERADTEARRRAAADAVRAADRDLETQRFAVGLRQDLCHLQAQRCALGYDEARHRHVRARVAQLRDAPAASERLAAARERLTVHAAIGERLVAEREDVERRQQDLERRCRVLHASLAEVAGAESSCRQGQDRVDALRRRRDEVLEQRGSLQAQRLRLDTLSEESTSLEARRQQLAREAWLDAQLVEAFGRDGIQALIIDSAIPEIEEEANEILRRLTNNRIQIAIDSLRDLKGGGCRETLDVKIADELGERPYDLYSGGEAFRTDFALRIALSKVLARRAGTRLRTLIIDEGFGTQDAQGLEQLREAIQRVSADFDKVLVVTHLEDMKSAFPVRIEVTKDPVLGSRFEMVE